MNDIQQSIDEIMSLMTSIKSNSHHIDMLEKLMDKQQNLISRLESDHVPELEKIKECLHRIRNEYAIMIAELKSQSADIKTSLVNVNFIKKYLNH